MIPRRTLASYSHIQRIQAQNSIVFRLDARTSLKQPFLRAYSSAPIPGPTKSTGSKEPPILSSTPPTRKKVDLHPSPRKAPLPSELQGSASKPPAPQVEAIPAQPSPSSDSVTTKAAPIEKSEASKTSEDANAIRLAIEDMRQATQHGILKPPPEGAGALRRLYHQAKELFKFYMRGLKLVYIHRGTVKEIERRLASEKAEGREPQMTRWESQFIRTYQQDLVKLVPFLMIVLVLEEIIPLIVMYVPAMLPSTCIMPSQLERIQTKAETTRKEALTSVRSLLQEAGTKQALVDDIQKIDPTLLKQICRAFGLASWGPAILAHRRLRNHLQYLNADDTLLAAEGRGTRLTGPELKTALWDRGFVVDGVSETSWRPKLAAWVEAADSDSRRVSLLLERAVRSEAKP